MSKISPIQAEALGLKPSSAKPVVKPVVKKTIKPAIKKAIKPVAKKATKLAVKPATKPVVKKAIKAAAKPVAKAAAKPAAKATSKKTAKKSTKKAKPEKVKMGRDSFTMPKDEYAQLNLLKARLMAMGQPAKKSELLRAGVKLLAAMSDNTLKTTLAKIPVIKTGRPNK